MTFILITGSIMTISIFLIYRLCHFFDIEMKWTSLVLCAVMAFIVNGMAITMSPFLDKGHYLRLGILVVTAAAVVTIFNERMLRREEVVANGCTLLHTEALPIEDQPEPPAEDTVFEARRKKTETADATAVTPPAKKEPVTEQAIAKEERPVEAKPKAADKPSAKAKPVPADDAQTAIAEAQQAAQEMARQEAEAKAKKAEAEAEAMAKAKAEKAAKEKAAQKKRQEAARKKAEAKAKAEAEAKAKAEAEAKAKAEAEAKAKAEAEAKAKAEAEAKAKAKAEAEAKAAAKKARREQEQAKKRQAHEQKLKQELSSMDSLDAILDFAYETKDAQPKDAIFAYHEAIDRYSDDDYTPFLVIELGNLYKEQANYSGAIATYKQALKMPIIAQNDAMCQEFTKNIHYLGTVQDILAKHAALSTPFPQIPGNIMQEIEDEFQAHSGSAK
ncbi:colicin import membrane protein [Selenomonas ruminantium]|uniref:Colicin import membrane protein n=1 Tax=Selenomonas ruminantium TaxID=971 RepID=A0A1M6WEI3_SELRU|nr:cell envelope integrity protein TolA [Selenomonas ruminantium]SHK92097.1 colicin import membrane protein [Selenomonas ruminantium]